MIPNTFPRTQGTLSREQYLTLLLLALLEQQPGRELRIGVQALEKVDSGGRLLTDWDSENQYLVLRVGSPSLVVCEVRGSGWTSLSPSQPAQQPPTEDKTKHRSPLSDEQILEVLRAAKANERMREWRSQGAAAVANMPEPEEQA
jgi:hypothetical protein